MSKHKFKERASMGDVSITGADLANNVFQLHGAASDGSVVFRKKLSRPRFARVMADHVPCDVAMEACPSAHHRVRKLTGHGHRVRLIAPHYVKPFLKRQKNDGEADRGCSAAAQADERRRGDRRGFKPVAKQSNDPGDRWKAQMVKADDALRRAQDRRTAGPGCGIPRPQATREAADRGDQRVACVSP